MEITKQVALFPVMQLEKLTILYQKPFPFSGCQVSAGDSAGKWGFCYALLTWALLRGASDGRRVAQKAMPESSLDYRLYHSSGKRAG